MGRSDDMLIVKGVQRVPVPDRGRCSWARASRPNYQIIVDRVNNTDTMEVLVEMTPEMFSDQLSQVAEKEKQVVAALKAMLGIYAKVRLVAPQVHPAQRGQGGPRHRQAEDLREELAQS